MAEEPQRINEILDEKLETLKNPQEVIQEVVEAEMKELSPKSHGGARQGSGMPKGYVTKKKRTALEAKNRFIERVHQHVDDLFEAQLDLAKGEKVLMVKVKDRDNDGKVKKIYHEVVTDRDTIRQYLDNEEGTSDMYEELNDEDHYYYMTIKPANNQAIEGMLNRAYGKAPEKIEIEGGFFKVNELNINIVDPKKIENGTEDTNIIDVEPEQETESSSTAS